MRIRVTSAGQTARHAMMVADDAAASTNGMWYLPHTALENPLQWAGQAGAARGGVEQSTLHHSPRRLQR